MFNSLKNKLLSIFLLFSTLCVMIIFLRNYYSDKKEKIDTAQRSINLIYSSNLLKFHVVEHFLSIEIRSMKFFKAGNSASLIKIDSISRSIDHQISVIEKNEVTKKFDLDSALSKIAKHIAIHKATFNELLTDIKLRGYGDYGYIGKMRGASHQLENSNKINLISYLTVRRNEKDYMLRYEIRYIDSVKHSIKILNKQIESNPHLSSSDKDTLLSYTRNYLVYFDSMTVMDKKMGLKDNSGLILKQDEIEKSITNQFIDLTNSTYKEEMLIYEKLDFSFVLYSFLLVLISFLFSYFLANRITKPISQLAEKTHLFVKSGFTNKDDEEIKSSDEEIRILIRNFNILKKEVANLLFDFKKKVADRTKLIEQQNTELTELNATKDKFFSIIAHDLRSPFTAIIGFSEVLAKDIEKYDKVAIKEFAHDIHNSANQTMALLENLLEWARLQNGGISPNFAPNHLLSMTNEICLLYNDSVKSKNIKLENTITSELTVNCDINMTKTVIRNLISNAIKFTGKQGTILISALQKENIIEVHVSDTGVGISAQAIPNLFRIDKSLSTDGTEHEKGTGLGLLLCKELIEKHGGRIWIESELGKGSTVKFTLKSI